MSGPPLTTPFEKPAVRLLARCARNVYPLAAFIRRSVRACASNAHVGIRVAFL